MVWIPARAFPRDSDRHYPEERPAHLVSADGFWIDRYPVTNARFARDGSVDVYIGPAAPDRLTNNWIPTAGKYFWLIARFYGPDKLLFDKTWVMPDVEKVS